MSKYWNEAIECAPKEELEKVQGENLRKTIKRVYDNVPYYRKKMEEIGLKPSDIQSVDDLKRLPFTYKTDLRENYPFGTFAVPMKDVVRVHASSGTTGKQTVVGYTQNDIDMWSDCVARGLRSIGVTEDDRVHVAYGYGLFTGGLGLHYGVEKIGAMVIPVSGGNTARQISLMVDFEATVLCCTPSYALYLADEMKAMGLTKEDLSLKYGVFGAEPWTEEMRTEIENKLGLKAYDIYGLSEIAGPGVATECSYRDGIHIQADNFIAEIIDPETGEVLKDGELGELVFTCITKEALPLIRYRTKDLCVLHNGKCACGRTTTRMEKIKGRSDDMMIIRGVNVFPSQIESVILKYAEVEPHYMIYIDRVNNIDAMEIHIEVNDEVFSDEVKALELLSKTIKADIDSAIGVSAKIRLVEQGTIKRSEGKAQRIVDKRKLFV